MTPGWPCIKFLEPDCFANLERCVENTAVAVIKNHKGVVERQGKVNELLLISELEIAANSATSGCRILELSYIPKPVRYGSRCSFMIPTEVLPNKTLICKGRY